MSLPAKALSPLGPSLMAVTEDVKKSADLCALGERSGAARSPQPRVPEFK
ncbi:hypothetical protein E2C01_077916 [Portunus trituberculatus]|uniref:Uncharacterized protein n=1 Tax=Portunus trituberculatus TaxID=210409 RepID=A0A5B7ISQ8_PORTR|nr:hypothetical protein [Portunus trituberculatus]